MVENMLLVFKNVLMLMWLLGVGVFLAKKGWLCERTQDDISKILTFVVIPCQIIISMPKERSFDVLQRFAIAGTVVVASYIFGIILSSFMFKKHPDDTRVVLRYATIYANHGLMGLPLVQAVFGSEAVIYAAICIVTYNVVTWTHGIIMMGRGDSKLSLKAIINPGIIGFTVGMILFLGNLQLPTSINSAVTSIGSMLTPLAMIMVGAQMSKTNPLSAFQDKKLYIISFMRLIFIPGLVMLVLFVLGVDPVLQTSMVILVGCPTAAFISIFSQMYRRDMETAAKSVLQTTLLSVITLPTMAMLSQWLISLR